MKRLLLSEWFGICLTLLMAGIFVHAIRSDRGPTPFESALSYTGIAVSTAWFIAYGINAWRTQR
jgi:hypothetical protein